MLYRTARKPSLGRLLLTRNQGGAFMNAMEIKSQSGGPKLANFELISIEKAEHESVWTRLKRAFAPSDLTMETWERLEMKRPRSSCTAQSWRNL